MTAQVAADLRAAAEVLRRDGWTQDTLIREDGCRCALGAIVGAVDPAARSVSRLDMESYVRFDAAARTVWDLVVVAEPWMNEPDAGWVGEWNDAPGRTADEVIAALEAAADAAEQQPVMGPA